MASNPGTSKYPGAADAFADPGTGTYEDATGYEHDLLHAQVHDAVEKIEAVLGTTAASDIVAGWSSGVTAVPQDSYVIQDTIAGGTFNNVILGTPDITGGTMDSAIFGTPDITGGTMDSATFGTPTLNTPTITKPTISGKGTISGTIAESP